jgi:HEAT repeat protein
VLRRAVSSGREAVDLRALHSLAQCRPAGLGDELLAIARGTTLRTALRTRALSLLPPDLARASAATLVRLVNELRRRAPTNDADELVAASAVAALGTAGGTAATDGAADALALDPHESIRAAGAHALGRLCPPAGSAQQVLRRAATEDGSRAVRRSAKEALKRCRL